MKTILSIVIGTNLCLAAPAVFAQDTQNKTSTPGSSGSTTTQSNASSAASQQMLVDSSALQNKKVTDKAGAEIGKLERILFDAQSGRARYGVVQVDKAWSLDNPQVVVPWQAFQVTRQSGLDYKIVLDTTKEKLQKAQRFDASKLDQLAARQAGEPIYAYWAVIWIDEGPVTPANTSSTAGTARGTSGSSTAAPGNSTSQPSTNPPKSSATSTTNPSAEPKPKQTGAQQ